MPSTKHNTTSPNINALQKSKYHTNSNNYEDRKKEAYCLPLDTARASCISYSSRISSLVRLLPVAEAPIPTMPGTLDTAALAPLVLFKKVHLLARCGNMCEETHLHGREPPPSSLLSCKKRNRSKDQPNKQTIYIKDRELNADDAHFIYIT